MINQGCCFSTVRHDTGSTGSCRKFPGRKEVFPLFLRVLAFTDNSIALTPSLFVSPKNTLVFSTMRNSEPGVLTICRSILLLYIVTKTFNTFLNITQFVQFTPYTFVLATILNGSSLRNQQLYTLQKRVTSPFFFLTGRR